MVSGNQDDIFIFRVKGGFFGTFGYEVTTTIMEPAGTPTPTPIPGAGPSTETEPNNGVFEEGILIPGECVTGIITAGSDDQDNFRVLISEEGTLSVEIDHASSGGAEGFFTLFRNDQAVSDNALDLAGSDSQALSQEPVAIGDRMHLRVLLDGANSPPGSEISYEIRTEQSK